MLNVIYGIFTIQVPILISSVWKQREREREGCGLGRKLGAIYIFCTIHILTIDFIEFWNPVIEKEYECFRAHNKWEKSIRRNTIDSDMIDIDFKQSELTNTLRW